MLTESQFREIADSLGDIVNELKKMNEAHPAVKQITIKGALAGSTGGDIRNMYNFERSDHSGPSIS